MKKLLVILFSLSAFSVAFSQETEGEGFNQLSLKAIHKSDIMWKKTVWRAIDLREKQNRPFMSNSKEITRVIIDAVKEGLVQPWKNDSLSDGSPLTKEVFLENIQIPSTQAELTDEEKAFMENESSGGGWGGDEGGDEGGGASGLPSGPAYFFPKDLYQLEIKEEMVFDKQRSVMFYDIISITMFVPADHPDNIKGIQIPIASFSYRELVEKVFADNPNAIWYNPYNDAEHRDLYEAFELRLFSSYIIKVSNPNNEYLVDIYGGDPKQGIMASQWKAFELLEYEHNLWEF